jgi:hypothetical protein
VHVRHLLDDALFHADRDLPDHPSNDLSAHQRRHTAAVG